MKDLLEYIARELVTKPEEVKVVETTEDDGTVHLSLSVDPEDMGLVIGKKGKVINAIRSLVLTAASKKGEKVFLELEEAERQEGDK